MNSRTVFAVLLVLVLIAGAIGIGVYGYNAGLAQAAVDSGRVLTPGAVPYYGAPGLFYRPWGFGFGFLGCLFPLFFFLLIFGVFRFLFWGGRWGGGYRRGMWGYGGPRDLEEW